MSSRRSLINDLVTDYRCAKRDGLDEYAGIVKGWIREVYKARHMLCVDRYGWPRVLNKVE